MWAALIGAAATYYANQSSSRNAARRQPGLTEADARAGVIGRVEGAKAAGLHPLAGLGSPVSGSMMPTGPSFDFNSIGEAVMRDREAKQRREEVQYNREQASKEAATQASRDALASEESKARIRLLTAQEAAERKRIADSDRDFAASQAALLRQAATKSQPLRIPMPRALREEDRVRPQYVPVRSRHGTVEYIPNPEIYDLELPSLVGAGTLAIPEIGPARKGVMDRIKQWWDRPIDPRLIPKRPPHKRRRNPYSSP